MRHTHAITHYLIGALFMLFLVMNGQSHQLDAADVQLNLPVNAGTVTITSPTAFAFNAVNASFNSQTISQDFTGSSYYFTVIDLKGMNSGYYTTLQMSGDLITGGNSIPSTNILFKSVNSTPVNLSGSSNPRVIIDTNANSYQALNTARNFLKRDAALNTGVLSQYGQNISMQIVVPSGQPAGAYAGILMYTLIEN